MGVLLRERGGQENGLGAERRGRGSVGKVDYVCMFCFRFSSLDITWLSWIRKWVFQEMSTSKHTDDDASTLTHLLYLPLLRSDLERILLYASR